MGRFTSPIPIAIPISILLGFQPLHTLMMMTVLSQWGHSSPTRYELSFRVTKITGGDIDPLAGSGTLTVLAPTDAVAPVSPSGHAGYTVTLEYKAPTPLTGVTLAITPPEGVMYKTVDIDSPNSKRGPITDGSITGTVAGDIVWEGLDFKKDGTFRVNIKKVTVSEPECV